jgi:excisionase family DNA binding protein
LLVLSLFHPIVVEKLVPDRFCFYYDWIGTMKFYERPHLYKSSQVAMVLGVSKKTLDRMIADGRIPKPVRDGNNNWRIWTHQDVQELQEVLTK